MTDRLARVATLADIGACVDLALVATANHGDAKDAAVWQAAFSRDLDDPQRHLVVAAAGDRILGYARARRLDPEAGAPSDRVPPGYYLLGLFVSQDHRRRGLGTSLTVARLDWIRQRAAEAWFFANARNLASIELHERLGFREFTRDFSFPGLEFHGGEGILFRLSFRLSRHC